MLPLLGAIAPFAPIIGGAIGALGSLLAPKPKTGLDLKQLRKDAEKAGFNPLTVLRSGAAGSYGHVADNRLSYALQTFGSGVANFNYDPYGQAKSLAEIRLAEAQIAELGRRGAPANMSLDVPSSAGTNNIRMGGFDFGTSPDWADAQVIEDRYGDVASWGYGIGVMAGDLAHNLGFKGDKAAAAIAGGWDGFLDGAVDFARFLDQRKVQLTARKGADGVTYYTGGGF